MVITVLPPVGVKPGRGSTGWTLRVKDSLFSTLPSVLIVTDKNNCKLSKISVRLSRFQSMNSSVDSKNRLVTE